MNTATGIIIIPDKTTMKTKPLAIGDRVRLTEDESKLSDLESDMQLDLADRSLSGRKFDAIFKAIEEKKAWVIVAIDGNTYELQLEGSKLRLGYMLDAEDLIPLEPTTKKGN